MKLKFIPERLSIIARLKGISISEIEKKMMLISGRNSKISIDRWTKKDWNPETFAKVQLLAEATDVPVGYYYYHNVSINMENLWVTIIIADTNEVVSFKFI